METIIILFILALLLASGAGYTVRHFKGKGGCCGSGGVYIEKKKLDRVIAVRTLKTEGMTCENCAARIVRAVNEVEGLSAKVDLRRKLVRISMSVPVADEHLRELVEGAGYTVTAIR